MEEKKNLWTVVKPKILRPAGIVPEPRDSTSRSSSVFAPWLRSPSSCHQPPVDARHWSVRVFSQVLLLQAGKDALEEIAMLPVIPAEGTDGRPGTQESTRTTESKGPPEEGKAAPAARPGRAAPAEPRWVAAHGRGPAGSAGRAVPVPGQCRGWGRARPGRPPQPVPGAPRGRAGPASCACHSRGGRGSAGRRRRRRLLRERPRWAFAAARPCIAWPRPEAPGEPGGGAAGRPGGGRRCRGRSARPAGGGHVYRRGGAAVGGRRWGRRGRGGGVALWRYGPSPTPVPSPPPQRAGPAPPRRGGRAGCAGRGVRRLAGPLNKIPRCRRPRGCAGPSLLPASPPVAAAPGPFPCPACAAGAAGPQPGPRRPRRAGPQRREPRVVSLPRRHPWGDRALPGALLPEFPALKYWNRLSLLCINLFYNFRHYLYVQTLMKHVN